MTIRLTYLPQWEGIGPCTRYPKLMYPASDERSLNAARTICRSCPVLRRCREWVLGLPYDADPGGVVAGMTPAERSMPNLMPDIDIPHCHKQCTKCEDVLPFSDFSAQANGAQGLRSRCKGCVAQATREYRAARQLTEVTP